MNIVDDDTTVEATACLAHFRALDVIRERGGSPVQVQLATPPARRPAPAHEPTVRPLPGPGGAPLALLHVTLPAATVSPHDHGHSYVVLIPLHGGVVVDHGGGEHELVPASAAYLDIGERIGVANRGTDAAELCVVVTPPDFAEAAAR